MGAAGPDPGRDARVVRRALRAGLGVWAGVGGGLVAAVVALGGSGREGVVVLSVAFVLGCLTASGWLLLAALLDLLAAEPPGRRRVLWTVAVVFVTLLSPVLALAASE